MIQLAQLAVHKTPPVARTMLDDIQILRRKKNEIDSAVDVCRSSHGKTIDSSALFSRPPQVHIDFVGYLISAVIQSEMRLILPEPDHLHVAASTVRLGRRQHADSFENVCLSLRVIPVDYICPR